MFLPTLSRPAAAGAAGTPFRPNKRGRLEIAEALARGAGHPPLGNRTGGLATHRAGHPRAGRKVSGRSGENRGNRIDPPARKGNQWTSTYVREPTAVIPEC
jgi:hypothetical protein